MQISDLLRKQHHCLKLFIKRWWSVRLKVCEKNVLLSCQKNKKNFSQYSVGMVLPNFQNLWTYYREAMRILGTPHLQVYLFPGS